MVFKFLIISLVFTAVASRRPLFYRYDYTYLEEFDAFYKLNWDTKGMSWDSALNACEKEDAELFYPRITDEWTVVKNLSEMKSIDLNTTDIFVGIQNEGIEDFLTVDGYTTPYPLEEDLQLSGGRLCATMDIRTGSLRVDSCVAQEYTPKPFVCKKVEPVSCPTIDKGYKYFKDLKKCYKINNHEQTWHEALHTCIMEGGILAVIENNLEAETIRKEIDREDDRDKYHVGFRRTLPTSEFHTIKGQQLRKVYNNFENSDYGNKYCGAVVLRNPLALTDVPCGANMKFICEIPV